MARRWRSKAGRAASARSGRRQHAGSAADSDSGRVAAAPDRGGGGGLLDPDAAALALYLSVVLHEAVELAGAVRDLVYHQLTEGQPFIQNTTGMFNLAMNAVQQAPHGAGSGFAAAFAATGPLPDPAAKAILEVVEEEMEKALLHLTYFGINHAAIDAFAAAFPAEAAGLAAGPGGRSKGQTRLDHLSILSRVFRTAAPDGRKAWSSDRQVQTTFEKAALAAASRTAAEAAGHHDQTFALAASASAVMLESIPGDLRTYLHGPARTLCAQLSLAISSAGGIPPERASAIPAAMLEGALECRGNALAASEEVVVRALRTAHHWASDRAAASAFRAFYGLAAGGAWKTARDRGRFESIYGRALEAAGGLDRAVIYALDTLEDHSWREPPFDEARDHVWEFFYGASGRNMAGWVEVAGEVDYRAAATSQQNAALVGACGITYEAVSGAAARAASRLR